MNNSMYEVWWSRGRGTHCGPRFHRLEHWVVLYGYGVEPDRVFVADPLRSMRHEVADAAREAGMGYPDFIDRIVPEAQSR